MGNEKVTLTCGMIWNTCPIYLVKLSRDISGLVDTTCVMWYLLKYVDDMRGSRMFSKLEFSGGGGHSGPPTPP